MNVAVQSQAVKSLTIKSLATASLVLMALGLPLAAPIAAGAQAASGSTSPAPGAKTNVVGVVTAIDGNNLTIKTDAGASVTVSVGDATRLLQTQPGQKDLSGATPIHIADVEVGDRVLARATVGDDGKTYTASTLVAMKQADLAQKRQAELQDWQRSGEGGLVKSVDPTAQTVTISMMAAGGVRSVVIHVTPATILRRYAPGSIEFNEARPEPFDHIKPGDQLRARGTRSADGGTLEATEIVSGTFRNVVATVISVDATSNTLTARDLVAKAPVTIKISSDSQLRKLPPMVAQMLAMRLKGASGAGGRGAGADGAATGGNGPGSGRASTSGPASASTSGSGPAGSGAGGQWRGQGSGAGAGSGSGSWQGQGQPGADGQRSRGGDLQQAVSRAPVIKLTDLQKGDAIMVVTTEGSSTEPGTAVTLLAGVEPMLQASASGSQSMLSSSWNLGGGGAAAEGAETP